MTYVDNPDTQRSNTDYIRASMRQPLLERDHKLDLARRWRDQNVAALHELVKSYMRWWSARPPVSKLMACRLAT